jgi:hypothetical protein
MLQKPIHLKRRGIWSTVAAHGLGTDENLCQKRSRYAEGHFRGMAVSRQSDSLR